MKYKKEIAIILFSNYLKDNRLQKTVGTQPEKYGLRIYETLKFMYKYHSINKTISIQRLSNSLLVRA